jgi:16S rRNA (adenine1518-N6/adenine1519-N6)-dimethyltransferase
LLVQVEYEPKGFFKIPASCFFPEPEVDSACVCVVRRDPSLLESQQKPAFTRIVKRAFSQRRKMMLKLLKEDWPANMLDQVFDELQIPAQTRAETVSLEQFVRLTKLLLKYV